MENLPQLLGPPTTLSGLPGKIHSMFGVRRSMFNVPNTGRIDTRVIKKSKRREIGKDENRHARSLDSGQPRANGIASGP
jgi:hypothetical protein